MNGDIHDVLGFSMEQTRWLLKRIVDGENELISRLVFTDPLQLLDVMICAATLIASMQKHHPEIVEKFWAKELPN